MKRARSLIGVALSALAVGATLGLASPAAHAGPPGYTKHGTYGWNDQCLGVGHYGQVNQSWTNYYCVTVVPSGWSGPGLYELWVQ